MLSLSFIGNKTKSGSNFAIASKFNPFIEPTCGNCNNSGLAIL